jgi:hypothetical protein
VLESWVFSEVHFPDADEAYNSQESISFMPEIILKQ